MPLRLFFHDLAKVKKDTRPEGQLVVNLTDFDSISYLLLHLAAASPTQDMPGRGVLGRCWSHKKGSSPVPRLRS